MTNLTDEQRKIINHPRGKHARILAVAGSGKTTTLVRRIQYLVEVLHVNPKKICILMFNRRARIDFQETLSKFLPKEKSPRVTTFHSFCYAIINQAVLQGLLPPVEIWTDDKNEMTRITLHKAIENLGLVDTIDPDEAMQCIQLYKGALITPEFAGHHENPDIPRIYKEFEKLRYEKGAITYDDFVPYGIEILNRETGSIHYNYDFVFVDEYQDVNLGQQKLVEILSGNHADIMLVGDDDQTIYEWRGARPEYILNRFRDSFKNKGFLDYPLSQSFRFGPVLAQCAQNVIGKNLRRTEKSLKANDIRMPATITLIEGHSEQVGDVHAELVNQIEAIIDTTKDPRKVIILGRIFAQLSGIEIELFKRKIPYRVIGRGPFFERHEILVLIDYLTLAGLFSVPLAKDSRTCIKSVLNTPNRKISRAAVEKELVRRMEINDSPEKLFDFLASSPRSPLLRNQRQAIEELAGLLLRVQENLQDGLNAGEVIDHLIYWTDYYSHFKNYYGEGEISHDRIQVVNLFLDYAKRTEMTVPDFLTHIRNYDTTCGRPLREQIVLTTVHRVKGQEFDYVVIPDCMEGNMPCLVTSPYDIYDVSGVLEEPEHSEIVENERRLFYVALTRAKKEAIIGIDRSPQKGSQSNSASPEISRFIHELEMDPTIPLIDGFHRCIENPDILKDRFIAALLEHASNKRVMNTMLNYYVKLGHLHVDDEIIRQIDNTQEIPFQYPSGKIYTTLDLSNVPSRVISGPPEGNIPVSSKKRPDTI